MKNVLWLFVFTILVPLGLILAICWFSGTPVLKPLKYAAIPVLPVFVIFAVLISKNSVSVSNGNFTARGFGFYSITVPTAQLALPAETATSMKSLSSASKISFKTNAVSLPGYHVGWFRLHNGSTAFIFVTNSEEDVSVFKGAAGGGKDLIINSSYTNGIVKN